MPGVSRGIKDLSVGEECQKKKQLCCNVARIVASKDYAGYLEYLQSPDLHNLPKRLCSVQPMPYAI